MRPRGMEFLEIQRDKVVKGVNGTLIWDKPLKDYKYSAREFYFEGMVQTTKNAAYDRIIVVGQYYYQLSVVTQPDSIRLNVSKEVDGFFDTFTADAPSRN